MDNRTRITTMLRIAILLALALVPGLVITALGHPALTSVMTLAALGALIPALMAPRTIAVAVVPATVILSAMAVPSAQSPGWAAVTLGTTGALVGIAAARNASGPLAVAAIGIVFLVAQPPATTESDVWSVATVILATGVAALWGLGAGLVIRRRRPPQAKQPGASSRARVGAYAATLTLILAISGWFVVDLDLGHGGGWFVMTFLIILQPYLQDAWRLTVERALGTVAGVLLAVALYALLAEFPVALYLIAALATVVALTLRTTTTRPYWQYVMALTPAVVLLEGLGTSVVATAEARVGFTLLAAAIAVVIEAAARPMYRRRAERAGVTRY